MRLAGRVALITGAGSGVGQGAAAMFSQEGANIAMLDVNAPGMEETRKRVEKAGRKALVIQQDVGDTAASPDAVRRVVQTWGAVHILVNCAGVAVVKPFLDVTEAEYDAVQSTNIRGMYFLSQAAAHARCTLCSQVMEHCGKKDTLFQVGQLPFRDLFTIQRSVKNTVKHL